MARKPSKKARIDQEQDRLMQIFAGADENRLKLAMPLIERAAYITVTLEDLEAELNKNGWTETYQNGQNQSGKKKSAAAEVHISLTKNLSTIMKQLNEIVPPAQKQRSRLEELMDS